MNGSTIADRFEYLDNKKCWYVLLCRKSEYEENLTIVYYKTSYLHLESPWLSGDSLLGTYSQNTVSILSSMK